MTTEESDSLSPIVNLIVVQGELYKSIRADITLNNVSQEIKDINIYQEACI